MGVATTIALWALGGLLFLYLLIAEFIDTIGRLEIVEKRWPRVWRVMCNRPFRLVLLMFLVVLTAKDLSQRWRNGGPPPLIVNIAAPAAPIVQFTSPNVQPLQSPTVAVKQYGNGNTANPITDTAPIKQGDCGVVQLGGSNNTASPNCVPPQRKLTEKQHDELVRILKKSCPFRVAVRPVTGNEESMVYAAQFVKFLQDSGCTPERPKFLIDTAPSYGVALVIHDVKDIPPGADALAGAFQELHLPWSREATEIIDSGTVYVMVGLNDSKSQP
jgi:hypothetical protein